MLEDGNIPVSRRRRKLPARPRDEYMKKWIVQLKVTAMSIQFASETTAAYMQTTMPAWWYFWRKLGACLPSEFLSTRIQLSTNS